ncbi:MAG: DUF4340 domain-containing protein [bacterium]
MSFWGLSLSMSGLFLLLALLGLAVGCTMMVAEWKTRGTRLLTVNVLTLTATLLLFVHRWIHRLTIMHVVWLVALYGVGLGAFLLVAEWKSRGPRFLTTVVLSLATLSFASWHLWLYKAPRRPKDYELVKNRVVKDFRQAKADRVVLTRHGKSVTFVKRQGRWLITSPIKFPADGDVVDNLLTEIRMLDKHRTIRGGRSKAEYGLDKKSVLIEVRGATTKPLLLTLGNKDVTGARIFLAKNDEPNVLMVNKHFQEALDKPLNDFREATALPFKETDVRSLTLSTPEGQRANLTVKKKEWTLHLGAKNLGQRANAKTAEDLVRKLKDLRATHFLGDGAAALTAHGLDTPVRTLVVDDGKSHTLLLGGPCPKRRAERIAGRRGPYPVAFCLRAKELKELDLNPDDLRDARLTGVDDLTVKEILLQAGDSQLHLKKAALDWIVVLPKGSKLKTAAASQVTKFVQDLKSYTVLKFLPPPPAGLAVYGLDKPSAVLTLTDENGRKEVIRLGKENPQRNFYAQRSGEQMVVVIHRSAGELLTPSLLRFRDRNLITFRKEPTEAVKITARTGAVTEEAVYEGGLWTLKKPARVKVDMDALDNVLSVLAMFQVQRFVADAPLPAHGLAVPTRTLTVSLEVEDVAKPGKIEKKSHTIKIGQDAPKGGCYGQLGDVGAPVFLLSAAHCKDLRALLANRRLAELRLSQVTEFKLTRGGGTEQLERRGAHWGRKNGPRVGKLAVENLLTDISKLRALRVVSYGAPQPQHGLANPQLRIDVLTREKGAKPIRIDVGAPFKEGAKVIGHFAIRSDRALVYLLDVHDVDTFRKAKF